MDSFRNRCSRELMKQELEDDQKSNNLYICTRLNERGKQLIQNCSKKQLMRATRQCLELI
jgi:hypothetical protein